MEEEHDQHEQMLAELLELTHQNQAPRGACGSWIMLYEGLNELVKDLQLHIDIENSILLSKQINQPAVAMVMVTAVVVANKCCVS